MSAPFSHLSGFDKAKKTHELFEEGMTTEHIAQFMGWKRQDTVLVMLSRFKRWSFYEEKMREYNRSRRKQGPRSTPHNAWPKEAIQTLFELWPTHSASDLAPIISEILGREVGRGAITGKARRLGMPEKDRWFRRPRKNGTDEGR